MAALYVVLGHIAALVDPSSLTHLPSKAPVWLQSILGVFGYGHLAVAAFIVISGFCLWLALFQRNDTGVADVGKFLIRRCKRILPAYYGCLLVSILVALYVTPRGHGMPFSQYLPVTEDNVLAHAFMVQNVNPSWMYKLNGVLWSISIEFQLYFLFPLLARGMRRPGWLPVLVATIVASVAMALMIPRGVKLYPWFLAFFFVGMVAAWYALAKPSKGPWLWFIGALGLATCIVATSADWSPIISECGIVLTVIALLAEGTRADYKGKKSIASVFAVRPLAFVGAFSYSLYLMHHPILQVFAIFRPRMFHTPLRELAYLLAIGLPVVLALSLGFSLVCERQWVIKALKALKDEPCRK